LPGEELVRLGGAGRHHDALGAHLHELARTRERHARPVEQAERGVALHDLDRGVRPDASLERPDRVERRARCDAGADREPVAQQHAFAVHGRLERRGQAGDPAPTTTVSQRTCLETVRVAGASMGSGPEPVARRIIRSAVRHANRGRMKVFR
jgi:hypothetical protein